MAVTIQDIIKKHKTSIDLNKVSKKLKELTVLKDEITLNDIPKPKHTTETNERNDKTYTEDIYTYNINPKTTLIISVEPSNYRTLNVEYVYEPGDVPPVLQGYNYKGDLAFFS